MEIKFLLNGEERAVKSEPDTPLLWVLREELGLCGTKYGCGRALCGACTVHVDGAAVRSCALPVASVRGRKVTTIEALGASDIGRAVQQAWIDLDVVQCGWCQPGQCMSAAALLAENPAADDRAALDDAIDSAMSGNLCRCGTYQRIRAAIHRAAQSLPAERRPR